MKITLHLSEDEKCFFVKTHHSPWVAKDGRTLIHGTGIDDFSYTPATGAIRLRVPLQEGQRLQVVHQNGDYHVTFIKRNGVNRVEYSWIGRRSRP